MKVARSNAPFMVLFGALALTAITWLVVGVLPAVAGASESFHDSLHGWGRGGGLLAEIAANAGRAAHGAGRGAQVFFDYLFSLFNLGLGILMIRLRPRDTNARLLAFALVGSAVAFNLQGHDALQVLPTGALSAVDVWHVSLHVVSGLCYIAALLLFPEGKVRPAANRGTAFLRVPLYTLIGLFFTGLSLITTDDHTMGLVVVFGIFIPVAGVGAQLVRYFRSSEDETKQHSRLLLLALTVALSIAIALAIFTSSRGPAGQRETRTHEVAVAQTGTYFFRCDPHPDDMVGSVRVVATGSPGAAQVPNMIRLSARQSEFSTDSFTMVAGRESIIRFTNFDTDLHNIAFYRSPAADEPLFIGPEFSANASAVSAFRIFRGVFAVIPIALFIGLVRFRLWNVERVINRTLVYGLLAAFITLTYLGIVVGIGTWLGAGRQGNLVLSIIVTALLALLFQPLRVRMQRLANRLVYGKRATPYEVLTEFSQRVGDTYAFEDVIPRIAETIGQGTGAERAEVWLRIDSALVLSSSWPAALDSAATTLPLSDDELPPFPDPDRAVAVRHQGELLGALTVKKPPGASFSPMEDMLLEDVASQAGLVLRNATLAAELQARLAELRASRQRIVSAQDEERRRIERNIHDGAQQHLVGLAVKIRLAQDLANKDPDAAKTLLSELQSDTTHALEAVRDLARGIYPPVLADKGLVHALEAHARRCPVEVRVEADDIERLGSDIETAVYFCCLEAIQNTVKHVGRGPITVTITQGEDRLEFGVRDPGPGFDSARNATGSGIQNMSDRVAALGGSLRITSHPDSETVVRGTIPLR